MRWGVIARAEDRGLGNQCYEIARYLRPDYVLVLDMGELARGFTPHFDRYEALGIPMDVVDVGAVGPAVAQAVRYHGLDVVYSAETFYDPMVVTHARLAGAATVLHVNPEFHKYHAADNKWWPKPTAWWAPTPWLLGDGRLPAELRVVPMGAPQFRSLPAPREPGPLRVLHTIGHRASYDRNGTVPFLMALRYLERTVEVTVRTQDGVAPVPTKLPFNVSYRTLGATKDKEHLYEGADVLVLPRRYGGLCLPAVEAAAAGLALVMPGCPPNAVYPLCAALSGTWGELNVPLGVIGCYAPEPRSISDAIESLCDEQRLADAQALSMQWARAHAWPNVWEQHWLPALTDAVESFRG